MASPPAAGVDRKVIVQHVSSEANKATGTATESAGTDTMSVYVSVTIGGGDGGGGDGGGGDGGGGGEGGEEGEEPQRDDVQVKAETEAVLGEKRGRSVGKSIFLDFLNSADTRLGEEEETEAVEGERQEVNQGGEDEPQRTTAVEDPAAAAAAASSSITSKQQKESDLKRKERRC
jgi:hypothetical protein